MGSATGPLERLGIIISTNPYITLVGKGRKSRNVPLMPKTVKHLEIYLKEFHPNGDKAMLNENGIIGSMSAPGCPYDNSCVESFFASLKKELIYRKRYATIEEVKADVFRYLELFYNRKRLHGSLGYMSPVDYRLAHCAG